MEMTNELFYHKDKLNALESNFIQDMWFPLYELKSTRFDASTNYFVRIYGYLIKDYLIEKCFSKYEPDQEGTSRSAVYGDNIYQSFCNEGIEPLIVKREFNIGEDFITYTDISEELILYFNLYEELENKHNRKYYYLSYGEKELVLKVESDNVYIKYRYLVEYLAIRKMHYVICFRFEAETNIKNPFGIEFKITPRGDKGVDIKNDDVLVNSMVRHCMHLVQSWISGKKLIRFKPIEEIGYHYDDDNKYESFKVDFDENGKVKEESCKSNALIPVFFSKKVLDKYYTNSSFSIEWNRLSNRYFSLKMDNNNDDYIVVFLKDLAMLPHKEQIYWKSYNIEPSSEYKFSESFYNSMVLGTWNCGNETVDLVLKEKYSRFNELWYEKHNWYLFKPLNPPQDIFFKSLHLPTSNEIEEFCNQIETVTLLLVDSINVEELKTTITPTDKERSISLLGKYLVLENIPDESIITFLRNLQTLRSGITKAHRFSKSNKGLPKATTYFKIDDRHTNLRDAAKNIFQNAINMIDCLSEFCNQKE
jgi:hypothetical protein